MLALCIGLNKRRENRDEKQRIIARFPSSPFEETYKLNIIN